MSITDNVRQIREIITDSCARAGRNADEVTLIAVSKTHPAPVVLEAVEAGVQHFGENRVEEAETKIPVVNQQVAHPVTWHMVGHIQSRKARDVVPLFQCIHSLDSAKLAHKLSQFAVERGITRNVLLEVNVSGEAAKYGFDAVGWDTKPEVRSRLWSEIEPLLGLPGITVRGLMTMAPIVTDQEQARPVFANLAALRRALAESFELALPDLSMGMTDDYPVAVEEGATLVRIGRAIFGKRLKT